MNALTNYANAMSALRAHLGAVEDAAAALCDWPVRWTWLVPEDPKTWPPLDVPVLTSNDDSALVKFRVSDKNGRLLHVSQYLVTGAFPLWWLPIPPVPETTP